MSNRSMSQCMPYYFFRIDIPPRENILSPWLPQQGLAMIYAPRGVGKTYVALNIAFAVASGTSFLKWEAKIGKGGHQRGTSKREDVLDTVISLEQGQDYNPGDGATFEVHFKKARGFYGEETKPFKASLVTDANHLITWETLPLSETTFDKVLVMAEGRRKQHKIAEALNIHKSNVSRYVTMAKQQGKLRSCVA
jgi:hypothetical protein